MIVMYYCTIKSIVSHGDHVYSVLSKCSAFLMGLWVVHWLVTNFCDDIYPIFPSHMSLRLFIPLLFYFSIWKPGYPYTTPVLSAFASTIGSPTAPPSPVLQSCVI